MRIAIDIDGVLASFNKQVIRVANEIWPGKIPLDYEPPDWGYKEVLSGEDWGKVWDKIKSEPYFWMHSPAYAENCEALRRVIDGQSRIDLDIYYITSRMDTGGKSALWQTRRWLSHQGLISPKTSVIPVRNPDAKLSVVDAIGIDLTIDDYGPTVESLVSHGRFAVLLDRPWNQEYQVWRVSSLKEFLKMVNERGMLTWHLPLTDLLSIHLEDTARSVCTNPPATLCQ